MPEGHVSHRNAILLTDALVGHRIVRVDEGERVAAQRMTRRLTGRTVDQVDAVGKHMLVRFDDGSVLHSHLGMVGRWRVQPAVETLGRGYLWLALWTDTMVAAQYKGPTLRLYAPGEPVPAAVRRVGRDLLAADGSPAADVTIPLHAIPADRLICDVLLDQRIVSGVGNIYRSEALWDVGVNPWTPVGELTQETADALAASAARQLSEAVGVPGSPRASTRTVHSVYRRTGRPCPRCGTPIRTKRHGDDNRSIYWCPTCQRAAG